MVGLSDGLVPISLAEKPSQIEEERRLLYVGITRAKEHLFLSYAAARVSGSKANRRASRFLKGIWPSASQTSRRKPKKLVEGQLEGEQLELFQTLKQWRLAISSQNGLPAYTVLPDVTLRALAVHRPQNLKDLAAMPGIGPSKLERFGPQLLAMLAPTAPSGSDQTAFAQAGGG